MERAGVVIPSNVYKSLSRLIQSVKDSRGSGEIFIVQCDSYEILQEFENQLKDNDIEPHVFKPESWEDIRENLLKFGDDPEWGVAIWKFDSDTPDELFGAIDFNRDAFFEVKWASIFWTTPVAVKKLMKKSPNFWRYRTIIVSFPPIPREPQEIAHYFDRFTKPIDEWKQPEDIERELKSLKKLLKTTKDPIRRARFLAQLGKLELSLFEIKGEKKFLNYSLVHLKQAVFTMESHKSKDLVYAETLINYGVALSKLTDYNESIKIFERVQNVLKELSKDNLLSVLEFEIYKNLGSVYGSVGDYGKALKFFKKALDINLKIFGKGHPSVSMLYNNLGLVYGSIGKYDKAIKFYKKAINIGLKALEGEHPILAVIYNNLGLAYKSKGENGKAIKYYKKALEIALNVYGKEHPDILVYYNNLGVAYVDMKKYYRAIDFYKKALEIALRVLGRDHLDMAYIYSNLGAVYRRIGEFDKATKYYRKVLEIYEKKLGECHPYSRTTLKNLLQAYRTLSKQIENRINELERKCK